MSHGGLSSVVRFAGYVLVVRVKARPVSWMKAKGVGSVYGVKVNYLITV